MLLVLDTCDLGIGPNPSGGFVIRCVNIEGLPGVQVMIPVEGESADAAYEAIGGVLNKVKTFDITDLKGAISGPQAPPSSTT